MIQRDANCMRDSENGIVPYNRVELPITDCLEDSRECGRGGGDVTGSSPMSFSWFYSVAWNANYCLGLVV